MTRPDAEARRALARLTRALEKARRELESFETALRRTEGSDFSPAGCDEARRHVTDLLAFAEAEGERLREFILRAGGVEPRRLRPDDDGG